MQYAGEMVNAKRPVDMLLVNPPTPDGAFWAAEDWDKPLVWPQVSLAQLAAMLSPDYRVAVIDAAAQGLSWADFNTLLRQQQPRYYLTQVRVSTVQSDMYGVFLARTLGARTIVFGSLPAATIQEFMGRHPALDFVLQGEPELTLRELIDTLEVYAGRWPEQDARSASWAWVQQLCAQSDPDWQPAWTRAEDLEGQLRHIHGLVWRFQGQTLINPERPLLRDLDALPLPHHHRLPLRAYHFPLGNGPYACVVTNRGGPSVRARTPENIMAELWLLYDLGIRNVYLAADLFTAGREHVLGLCKMMIEEELPLRWICNARVNAVDEVLLAAMGRAGCCSICWRLESAGEQALTAPGNDDRLTEAPQVLRQARRAGIKNWGYFTIGRPGETEASIKETIAFARNLPLDLAFFHPVVAPGLSFWTGAQAFEMNGHRSLNGRLPAEELAYWQKRAFREWVLRPGSVWGVLKGLNNWARFKSAPDFALPPLEWIGG